MNESTTIATVDAKRALADLGEPPRITDTIATPAPAPASAGLIDKLGQAFDNARHERDRTGNPKMRADGGWMLKRGNGARKARGEAPAGAVSYVVPPSTRSTTDPAASSAPQPTAGAAGDVVAALPAPEGVAPLLTEADYEATALGVTNGSFSLMQLMLGDAWKPDTDERAAWTGALRRLWCAYQLPRLGPLIEVLFLLPATIAKRRHDARTRQGYAKMKAWLGWSKPDKPAEPDERAVA